MRRGLVAVVRGLQPLRLVHGYGVFPPHTAPAVKLVPILQGSADGEAWRDYEWRDMVCDVDRAPPFVAPRQPRVDYKVRSSLAHIGCWVVFSTSIVPH
jgi:hypothetical protein